MEVHSFILSEFRLLDIRNSKAKLITPEGNKSVTVTLGNFIGKGAMNSAFHLKIKDDPKKYVVKVPLKYRMTSEAMVEDCSIIIFEIAKKMANCFNSRGVPKKVKINIPSLLILEDLRFRMAVVEEFLEGDYVKYNNNKGWVDDNRNTPNAFSHFSFIASKGQILIADIQGVGHYYTDIQIHYHNPEEFGQGNLSHLGIVAFFQNHKCNPICEQLGIATEVKIKTGTYPKGFY
ncbi:protein serine/threonine kinase [Heterostelium album PN500]|uniref:Protein serine/threonine kinase n=1 Tax=Heterostelium pallidum (strain ATCC 26659 / Pp 5 / PN500) TaxID=670386 RepID=D3B2G4_HETP5|nr:protein serine/threonine kinase [Heterostelium album PN500]EFA83512.1 protein serine/threonine kinase [Heterostelium album PN500]|eukprot:XP_020435629.1 protein serine/threonine kinase [Heterostelium album PN500]